MTFLQALLLLAQSTVNPTQPVANQVAVGKGPGFAVSRAAVINAAGTLDGASDTTLSDCMHVDGSSAPCSDSSGAVASVFGRTGTVTAETDDYNFNQLAGSASANQVPNLSGLNGSLSPAQIAQDSATSGQYLEWNGSVWVPANGSAGVVMASQLGDFSVAITTANTVLTIGANCSAATPCNVRVGGTVYQYTTPATATISAGSPTGYIYVDSSGNLSVGVATGTVTCNAHCVVTNAATWPAVSVSLWTWTAVSGAWVVSGGTDMRAWLGVAQQNVTAGAALVESGSQISFDTTTGLQQSIANASGGTTAGLLVKPNSSGQAATSATTDTAGAIGICSANCGTSGTAIVVVSGLTSCYADGTVTAGDYIQIGTSTAGRCLDAGATVPSSGEIIGRALTSTTVGDLFGILLQIAPPAPAAAAATFGALTDGSTVTWAIGSAAGSNKTLTFTAHSGSRTLNITNPVSGGYYTVELIQDGTGGEGLTLGSGCTWTVSGGGSGAVTLSTGAGAVDVLTFYYNGTQCRANLNKNFN